MWLTNISSVICLVLALAATSAAQTYSAPSAPQSPQSDIPQQLSEIQAQQDELRTRVQQLDEAMLPENIERSLAGVGSTKPEELRENRRRALETEKNGLTAKIAALDDRRVRLQASMATTAAVQAEVKSAQLATPPTTAPTKRQRPQPRKKRRASRRP
jgi:uncharacterized protein YlxW (UPF0749 family)